MLAHLDHHSNCRETSFLQQSGILMSSLLYEMYTLYTADSDIEVSERVRMHYSALQSQPCPDLHHGCLGLALHQPGGCGMQAGLDMHPTLFFVSTFAVTDRHKQGGPHIGLLPPILTGEMYPASYLLTQSIRLPVYI